MAEEEMPPISVGSAELAFEEDNQDYNEYGEDTREDQQFGSSYNLPVQRESLFSFFKHILGVKDSSKVANLDRRELGMLDLSVRNCEYLGKLGDQLHNKSFGQYFMMKGEITLATSMSKKGWLPELVVSQKRFTQRAVQPVISPQPAKKGFLGLGGKKNEG